MYGEPFHNDLHYLHLNCPLSSVLVNPINLEMKLQAPRHRTVACFN